MTSICLQGKDIFFFCKCGVFLWQLKHSDKWCPPSCMGDPKTIVKQPKGNQSKQK